MDLKDKYRNIQLSLTRGGRSIKREKGELLNFSMLDGEVSGEGVELGLLEHSAMHDGVMEFDRMDGHSQGNDGPHSMDLNSFANMRDHFSSSDGGALHQLLPDSLHQLLPDNLHHLLQFSQHPHHQLIQHQQLLHQQQLDLLHHRDHGYQSMDGEVQSLRHIFDTTVGKAF